MSNMYSLLFAIGSVLVGFSLMVVSTADFLDVMLFSYSSVWYFLGLFLVMITLSMLIYNADRKFQNKEFEPRIKSYIWHFGKPFLSMGVLFVFVLFEGIISDSNNFVTWKEKVYDLNDVVNCSEIERKKGEYKSNAIKATEKLQNEKAQNYLDSLLKKL